MSKHRTFTAIGLMSGTSIDGVDAAVIETDGYDYVEPKAFVSLPYREDLRQDLRACLKADLRDSIIAQTACRMTRFHTEAVHQLMKQEGLRADDVDVIGFHGHTIVHAPHNGISIQIGHPHMIARDTCIDTIGHFRTADIQNGGQGAPLLPLYHRARVQAESIETPVAILNIGGVANVTWIGPGEDDILAFDTGPGNALVDDLVQTRTGKAFDNNGEIAASGSVHWDLIEQWFENHDYFQMPAPKSLDRDAWALLGVDALSTEDAAATLSLFTVKAVALARNYFSATPKAWYVTGGGRKNAFIMRWLEEAIKAHVRPVEEIGWNGDALEAEGFAYLAVRSLLGEALSVPQTTGVRKAVTGGRLFSLHDHK